MDNAVAREARNAHHLQTVGEAIGEPLEISYVRRDDFKLHKGKAEGDDVIQAGSSGSAKTCRGHQGPAAFLIMTSGLNKVFLLS